jgi:hypothetical protein
MAAAPLVSADSHVNEPSDLWLERIEKGAARPWRVVDNSLTDNQAPSRRKAP